MAEGKNKMIRSVFVCLFVICASGCSSSHQIASSSNQITDAAHSSRGRFVWIADEATKPEPNLPGIHTTALGGIEEQETIIKSAARIIYNLPGVKDVTPFWAELIVYGMVFLSLVGVIIILLHSGILQLLKRFVLRWLPTRPAND